MQIDFFDASQAQELAHLNGRSLAFTELFNHHEQRRKGFNLVLDAHSFDGNFHPYGADSAGWKHWELHLSAATQLISGHVPSKEELKAARDFVRRLDRDFKRSHVDARFVTSFLPYLVSGFKTNPLSNFYAESNSVDSLVGFTESLYSLRQIAFSSFLCAHRDPNQGDILGLLQTAIPAEKIRAAVSIIAGLAHNARKDSTGSILFLQQGGSAYATSSVFPEVTVAYLESGKCETMLEVLDYQATVVRDTLAEVSTERFEARLVSLDVLTRRICHFLRERYGANWRSIDFEKTRHEGDALVEIALEMTLPDVERMMPFFSDGFQNRFLARKDEIMARNVEGALRRNDLTRVSHIAQAIEWFMLQHSMTITAKAVYETAFYYLWGRYTASMPSSFAIGLDRDHARFQHFAWKLGNEEGQTENRALQSAPLYMRRNPSGRMYGCLNDLSYRQFWR